MKHNEDKLYSFIMRGELTKTSLKNKGVSKKSISNDELLKEYTTILPFDRLDEECVANARIMSIVYTAIASFENMVRKFVVKTMLEHKGENWWDECISESIKKKAESRQKEEEKIKWHTPRGDNYINYTEFGDLVSIMQQNFDVFEVHINSIDWARQILQTLERSRNVIMHSGELGRKDIERIGTNMRDWLSQTGY